MEVDKNSRNIGIQYICMNFKVLILQYILYMSS